MIDGASFALFISGALLLNIAPGPDMAFTLASTAKGGAKAGVAAAAGICTGSLIWAGATALGLAALIAASEHALQAIRIGGGLYLLYLAVRAFRAKAETPHAVGAGRITSAFGSAVVTNLLNPKVGLFFIAFLPAFAAKSENPALTMFLLGVIFSVMGSGILVILALAAGALRARLTGAAAFSNVMNKLSGGLFGALGLWLLLPHER